MTLVHDSQDTAAGYLARRLGAAGQDLVIREPVLRSQANAPSL